jgi:transcriptional regulator with XRE-family HTH domain
MYREKIDELRREKGLSMKKLSEYSGISIDTIMRIIHPENPDKDSPRIATLEEICKPLGVELWELFYMGSTSLVSLQNEINTLRTERDSLLVENGALKDRVDTLTTKVDTLKDQMIEVLIGGKKC